VSAALVLLQWKLGLRACLLAALPGRGPARYASCPQADRIECLGAALEPGESARS